MGISTFTSKEFVIFCGVSKIGNAISNHNIFSLGVAEVSTVSLFCLLWIAGIFLKNPFFPHLPGEGC